MPPHTSYGSCSRLLFGMLYPAYASYKAVKSKNIREYVSVKGWWESLANGINLEESSGRGW